MLKQLSILWLAGLAAAGVIRAENRALPGELTTPYPTLTNLAVEWELAGDDNLNAACAVEYRMVGETQWRQGMPLRRIPADHSIGTSPIYQWRNKLSGSIFDLKPDAEYEIRLKLSDPDGGKAERVVKARTRPVPRPAADAEVKPANPNNFEEVLAFSRPGDIILLSPGYYGEFTMPRDGEPGRPIVLRADGAHELIGSTFDSISLEHRRHIILEGLTVYGSIELRGAEDCAVRYCKVDAKFGIIAKSTPGAKNCYIADNTISYVMPWTGYGMGCCLAGGGAACVGEGIEMTGPGNVIAYNKVTGYRDCISTMEDLWVYDQRCIDIYNNDIDRGLDDAIEADFTMGNCRIMRNRITNCFISLSSQPGLGGPTYFLRNVMYNVINVPYKLARDSKGDVVLHNTVVKVGDGFMVSHSPSRALFRNNLMIGGSGYEAELGRYGAGRGLAIFFRDAEDNDLDYDGVGASGVPFRGEVGRQRFSSLEELRRLTSEKHAVQVDMSVFANSPEFPDPHWPARAPADLRLKRGSVAEDAGQPIPGINDDFGGKAPDLGAYEVGQEAPHYGPRPQGVDEETEWLRRHGKRQ